MTTELHERGLARRKEVLGAAQVEQTYKNVDKFTAPFQEVVNEYVWGAVWSRPGLETRTRCLLTIGMFPDGISACHMADQFAVTLFTGNPLQRDVIGANIAILTGNDGGQRKLLHQCRQYFGTGFLKTGRVVHGRIVVG